MAPEVLPLVALEALPLVATGGAPFGSEAKRFGTWLDPEALGPKRGGSGTGSAAGRTYTPTCPGGGGGNGGAGNAVEARTRTRGSADVCPPSSSSSSRPGELSEGEKLDDDEPVDTGFRGGILLREGPGRILPPLAAWQLLPPKNMAQYRGAVLSPKDLVGLGNGPFKCGLVGMVEDLPCHRFMAALLPVLDWTC